MTESEDEQAGPDVPEPETELTLHQTIELMLARAETTPGSVAFSTDSK